MKNKTLKSKLIPILLVFALSLGVFWPNRARADIDPCVGEALAAGLECAELCLGIPPCEAGCAGVAAGVYLCCEYCGGSLTAPNTGFIFQPEAVQTFTLLKGANAQVTQVMGPGSYFLITNAQGVVETLPLALGQWNGSNFVTVPTVTNVEIYTIPMSQLAGYAPSNYAQAPWSDAGPAVQDTNTGLWELSWTPASYELTAIVAHIYDSARTNTNGFFSALAFAQPQVAAPQLDSAQILPNHNFTFQVLGPIASICTVQSSSDLKVWNDALTITNFGGQADIIDASGSTQHTFYRAVTYNPAPALSSELVYEGVTNSILGDATLSGSGSLLDVSNLGTNGQDGVELSSSLARSYGAIWQDLDPNNTLPAGVFVQCAITGTAGTVTDGLLGSSQCGKTGPSNCVMTADFSPVGASTETIEVYNGTNLMARLTGQSGALCTFPRLPGDTECPGPTFPYPPFPDPFPYPYPFPSGDGGVLIGWTWPGPLLITVNGSAVMGDSVYVRAEGAPLLESLSGVELLGSGISSLVITNEMWLPDVGLMHTNTVNYLFAHDPLPTNFVGRLTQAQFMSIMQEESNYLLSVGIPAPYVAAAITSSIGEMTNLGMFYVDGGQAYFGSPVPTEYWPAYVFSNLVAQGLMDTNVQAQLNYVSALAANGTDPDTVLQYVTSDLVNQEWTPAEQQQINIYASVFDSSFHYWSGDFPWGAILADAAAAVGGAGEGAEGGGAIGALGGPAGAVIGAGVGAIVGGIACGAAASYVVGNASVAFVKPQSTSNNGLLNQLVGASALDIRNGNLIIQPLSNGVPYGVSVVLPNVQAWDAEWQPLDTNNAQPVGEYVQSQVFGSTDSVTNSLLASWTETKAGPSNYVVTADFSPLGASNVTVQVYSGTNLMATRTGQNGTLGTIAGCVADDHWGNPIPPGPGGLVIWGGALTMFGPTPIDFPDGSMVVGDRFVILPEGGGPVSSLSQVVVLASGVPQIVMTHESVSVTYGGLLNTSLGNATLVIASNLITVSNLGSSGQDGVVIRLNGNESFEADLGELDPGNALAAGAQLNVNALGTGGSVSNGVLGSVQVTKMGVSNYAITANFPSSPSNTFTVNVFNQGALVASQSGLGGLDASGNAFPLFFAPHFPWDIEIVPCIFPGFPFPCLPVWCPVWPWCFGVTIELTWHWPFGPYYINLPGQAPLLADAVTVTPDVPSASAVTGLQLLGSGLPQIPIVNEMGTPNFSQLQVLLPGETNAPNTLTGKTGTPTPISLGAAGGLAAVTCTVLAVDPQFNPVANVTDTITLTDSVGGIDPTPAGLVNGSGQFTVYFSAPASNVTLTATDTTSTNLPPSTSTPFTVGP